MLIPFTIALQTAVHSTALYTVNGAAQRTVITLYNRALYKVGSGALCLYSTLEYCTQQTEGQKAYTLR